MPPFDIPLLARGDNDSAWGLHAQWSNPGDIFSVLLIVGGDVVATALAQLAGNGLAPVTFSFGWVAYSVGALMSALGQNKLMPSTPDCNCIVINGKSGFTRQNSSWIIGRLVRDFPVWWDAEVARKFNDMLDDKWRKLKVSDALAARPQQAGLVVSVYEPSQRVVQGTIQKDYVYVIGCLTMVLQLGVAVIPGCLWQNWGVLVVTIFGTALSALTGLLPQWKREKWACRRKARSPYILTRGNGAQHAIVVLGNSHGFNLEDLASGQTNVHTAIHTPTQLALLALCILWVLLLMSAAGLKDHSWFLLAVGALGMLQNLMAAGSPRKPETFGLWFDFVAVYAHQKVMDTLLELDHNHAGVGRALVPVFFPGELSEAEVKKWDEMACWHRQGSDSEA